jgi:aflatoxin B1 aldehyde reductase
MKLILGTMTFADQVDQPTAQALLTQFAEAGYSELDTAYQYVGGKTEQLLGKLLPPADQHKFTIASKVNPWNDFGLQPDQIEQQMGEILQRLGRDHIDLLYLHSPDLNTPVEDTLKRCFEMYQQGKFKTFGLSNFAAWQVAEVVELCRSHGWMQPTVYQGMYNALTRDVERELFPCLRNYDMHFYAYNPLAGGLLTGKYSSAESIPDTGRFADNEGYQFRYWKRDYFKVLQQLHDACNDLNLKPVEVAMSWLVNHSMLNPDLGDGIILGVSKTEHLRENITASHYPPLDNSLIDILDQGWELIKPDCFKYFRP